MSSLVKNKKRKFVKAVDQKSNGKKAKRKIPKALDEEIESGSDLDSTEVSESRVKIYSSDEEEHETAQQKRLRLAKDYLQQLEAEEASKKEEEEDENLRDAVSSRLQHDISEQAGRLVKQVADQCTCPTESELRFFRGHNLSVTAIVLSSDDKFAFTASKDGSLCKWSLETYTKVKTVKGARKGSEQYGHTGQILCLAISSDDKFLAAGDTSSLIKLWNPADMAPVHTFKGHRGSVTGVAFRKESHTLFSCSVDRVLKVWNVDEMAYVETLFGHNSPVMSVDSLSRDRAISAGGRDKSVHVWKITEDSQLLFHGHQSSIECVCLINENNFFSGGDDNALSLWGVMKKKPLYVEKNAHPGESGQENWISSVAACHHTDLVASGSKDGVLKLWKCEPSFKKLSHLFDIPVKGFVNCIRFSNNGTFLVAAIGQEHRMGRWWRLKDARNGWVIVPLIKS